MTTLSFDEDINIKKSHFKNLSEFGDYILKNSEYYQLQSLPKNQVTEDILEKAEACRKMDTNDFVNI